MYRCRGFLLFSAETHFNSGALHRGRRWKNAGG